MAPKKAPGFVELMRIGLRDPGTGDAKDTPPPSATLHLVHEGSEHSLEDPLPPPAPAAPYTGPTVGDLVRHAADRLGGYLKRQRGKK